MSLTMGPEFCTRCTTLLEEGQIGLCDGCQPQEYENVTLYLRGEFMGNIQRIDVRSAKVENAVRYAQYTDAMRITYLGKGQRRERMTVRGYRPFAMVLRREDAFDPDDPFVPMESQTPGVTISQGRYSSCSDGYQNDFVSGVRARGITPLFERIS